MVSFGNGQRNAGTIGVTQRGCSLCKRNNVFNDIHNRFIRKQSTHTSPSLATKKTRKKRTKTMKKYAEMLVVTNTSSSECKATVRSLHPNDVKMMALADLNLNEFHKLKDYKKDVNRIVYEYSYNNLTDVHNFPHILISEKPFLETTFTSSISSVINSKINNELITPNIPSITSYPMDLDILQSIKPNHQFQPEALEEDIVEETPDNVVEEVPKKKFKIYDKKAREEVISKTLASYIEVCVSLRTPKRGLNALYFHRFRASKTPDRFPPLKNIAVYNALLKGFAAKGDFHKIREVVKFIEEEEVALNVQSFSAIFECLGRVNSNGSHSKYIATYVNLLEEKGISFDKIMNEATFLFDQRDRVLDALQYFRPDYVPNYEEPSVQFKNHLLNHLNHEQQTKGFPDESNNATESGIFSKDKLEYCIKHQIEIENNVLVTVKSIEAKPKPTEEILKYRKAWGEHLKLWEEAALKAFNRDLSAMSAHRSALNMEPYMRAIPIRDYITIIVDEAQKIAQGSETYSPTVNMLYRDLGAKVYARYKVLKKQKSGVLDKMHMIHKKYCEHYAANHGNLGILPTDVDYMNTRQKWQWAEYAYKHEGATMHMDHQEWVPTALQTIGKFLYNIIMHDLKIDVNVMRNNNKHKNYLPAFYTIFRNQGRLVKEEVKPHPILSKLYRASVPETLNFPSYELPMLCPPIPWVDVKTGGYLVAPCEVIRLPPQATLQKKRLMESDMNKLYPSLDALNQLASVPWKVNQMVLDVILEVFKSGGSAKLDVPEAPSSLEPPAPVTNDMDKTQKYLNFRQKLQYRRKKAEMYSLWCDCLYRLSLANHFRDDIFWLPHNMDFRGRVYPVPPHLNHLGSDLARSMLVFAESRPLGPDGLKWLKLHLINLTGLKKRDKVEDRLAYADDIMNLILDSADKPLTGKRWWAESDEPWQTLACCMEIAKAIRSPDPEKYLCHFPIHQDGSCNGLQHYAALGRDSAGAFSVNLCPAPVPQDVYSAVATLVEEKRSQDAQNGIEIAKILEGFVRRKVIKQTVMTTVYGVTRFGARLQIARQLKDIDQFPKESVWSGSSYLTGRTFESLGSMFTSTREIQDWFTECARLISSVCGQNVEWVTPMGLPVVQPYFRYKKPQTNGSYEIFHLDQYEKPNVMKQKNAFPPNFIHSLDSSHMMLTSLHCERAGITFVSVHDCYWTHPSTVHIMNKVCREQFVSLHSEPILEDLSAFLSEKFSYQATEINEDGSVAELTKKKLNRVLRKLPRTGSFNIKEVLESVYFFS